MVAGGRAVAVTAAVWWWVVVGWVGVVAAAPRAEPTVPVSDQARRERRGFAMVAEGAQFCDGCRVESITRNFASGAISRGGGGGIRTMTMPMPSPSKAEEEQEEAAMDDMMVTTTRTSTSLHTVMPSIVEVSSPLAWGGMRAVSGGWREFAGFAPYLELCDDCDDARRAPSHEYSARNSSHGPSAVGRIVPRPRKQYCSAHAVSNQHADWQSKKSDGCCINQHRKQKIFHMWNVQLSTRR